MLHKAVASIAGAAGWEAPAPDAAGVVTFRLTSGLRLELFSPNGSTVILKSTVCALPAQEREADALVEKALRHAAAGGVRRSILSLPPAAPLAADAADAAPGPCKLTLHRVLHSGEQAASLNDFFVTAAKEFLNDLSWWHRRLAPEVPRQDITTAFLPFSGFLSPYSGGA